ncbi:hypothetical protein M406DRAFT_103490, partial [Cryphonectria parasitica EP155]
HTQLDENPDFVSPQLAVLPPRIRLVFFFGVFPDCPRNTLALSRALSLSNAAPSHS